MVLRHAAGGIEHELHVVEFPLHFWRRVGHRVREKNDRHREQRGRQAIRAQHQKLQNASPALLTMIERHRDGLPTPRPLPKGEDDGQREQTK